MDQIQRMKNLQYHPGNLLLQRMRMLCQVQAVTIFPPSLHISLIGIPANDGMLYGLNTRE